MATGFPRPAGMTATTRHSSASVRFPALPHTPATISAISAILPRPTLEVGYRRLDILIWQISFYPTEVFIMKQHLFALYGRGASGKTTTIKCACKLFADNAGAGIEGWDGQIDNNEDIVCFVETNGVRVGFSSGGDTLEAVRDGLNELTEKGCKIVVCATRTSGETLDPVYEHIKENTHQLYWIRQAVLDAKYEDGHEGAVAVDMKPYRKKVNKVVTDFILALVNAELNLS